MKHLEQIRHKFSLDESDDGIALFFQSKLVKQEVFEYARLVELHYGEIMEFVTWHNGKNGCVLIFEEMIED